MVLGDELDMDLMPVKPQMVRLKFLNANPHAMPVHEKLSTLIDKISTLQIVKNFIQVGKRCRFEADECLMLDGSMLYFKEKFIHICISWFHQLGAGH